MRIKKILEKQGWHLISLLGLVTLACWLARNDLQAGSFLGLTTRAWLILALAVPILHQVYVVIGWRAELHLQLLSSRFGERAFGIWSVGFMVLLVSRPAALLGLGAANRGSLPIPPWFRLPLIFALLGISIYMAYSFVKYFGVERALGADHFRPDKFKHLPFVREGIFRWSSNAMYTFGFLSLWLLALLFQSRAALVAALFSHLYIWVHYFFTELPDLKHIYGRS